MSHHPRGQDIRAVDTLSVPPLDAVTLREQNPKALAAASLGEDGDSESCAGFAGQHQKGTGTSRRRAAPPRRRGARQGLKLRILRQQRLHPRVARVPVLAPPAALRFGHRSGREERWSASRSCQRFWHSRPLRISFRNGCTAAVLLLDHCSDCSPSWGMHHIQLSIGVSASSIITA